MLSSAVPARLGRVRLQRPPSTRPFSKPASHPNWNSRYKVLAGKVFFPVVHSVKKIIALKFHHDAMLSNSSGSSSKPKRKNSWWRLRWMRGWQTHPKTATLCNFKRESYGSYGCWWSKTLQPGYRLSSLNSGRSAAFSSNTLQHQCMMFKSLVQKRRREVL